MRHLLLIFILIIGLCACRTRKVDSLKKDSTTVHAANKTAIQSNLAIDTSKSKSRTLSEKNETIQHRDSSGVETEITPIPGTSLIVEPDGTFHGQASSVKTKYTGTTSSVSNTVSKNHESNNEQKGITALTTVAVQTSEKDSTNLNLQDRQVDAKPSYGPWPWAIGLTIVIIVIIVLIWFFGFRKK